VNVKMIEKQRKLTGLYTLASPIYRRHLRTTRCNTARSDAHVA
jgi:hypothetical protein